ncbi:hypothetical protein ScalyP_jg8183 [Parmales sp. scaly parma]|nr:hypothetical protein ScalyP_jg8183 [Parmales sp. scaly parma]
MLKAYQHALQKNPYQVKVASAVVIFSIGDLLAQLYPQFVKQKENHEKITPSLYTIDAKRTLVTVSYGVFLTTSVHHWWQFLEPRVNRLVDPVKSKLSNAFVKVALDQSVGAQFVNMGFFAIQGAMGSGSVTHEDEPNLMKRGLKEIEENYWDMIQLHWKFWPMFHLCNFYFFSLHYRPILMSLGNIGWSAVLSTVNEENGQKKKNGREGVAGELKERLEKKHPTVRDRVGLGGVMRGRVEKGANSNIVVNNESGKEVYMTMVKRRNTNMLLPNLLSRLSRSDSESDEVESENKEKKKT